MGGDTECLSGVGVVRRSFSRWAELSERQSAQTFHAAIRGSALKPRRSGFPIVYVMMCRALEWLESKDSEASSMSTDAAPVVR